MSDTVKIRITYQMIKGDSIKETSIDICAESGIALVLRVAAIEAGYLKERAKVYTLVNMLALLQGYELAEIVRIRYVPRKEASA